MSSLYNSVISCLQKGTPSNTKMVEEKEKPGSDINPDDLKENDAPSLSADKKTDEVIEPKPQVGILWRVTSGVVGTASGAVTGVVGASVGSVKWVAGKSYDAGSAVYNKMPAAKSFSLKKKDKKE